MKKILGYNFMTIMNVVGVLSCTVENLFKKKFVTKFFLHKKYKKSKIFCIPVCYAKPDRTFTFSIIIIMNIS